MRAMRNASIRELASAAYELEGRVVQGVLRRNPEGVWMIGSTPLDDWLSRDEGDEIMVVSLALNRDTGMEKKTCRSCGRDYVGVECPTCREARIRLRGR